MEKPFSISKGENIIRIERGKTTWIYSPFYDYWLKVAKIMTFVGIFVAIIFAYFQNNIYFGIIMYIVLTIFMWITPLTIISQIGLRIDGLEFKPTRQEKTRATNNLDSYPLEYFPNSKKITYRPASINYSDFKEYKILKIKDFGRSIESIIYVLNQKDEIITLGSFPHFLTEIIISGYEIWKENNTIDKWEAKFVISKTKLPPEATPPRTM